MRRVLLLAGVIALWAYAATGTEPILCEDSGKLCHVTRQRECAWCTIECWDGTWTFEGQGCPVKRKSPTQLREERQRRQLMDAVRDAREERSGVEADEGDRAPTTEPDLPTCEEMRVAVLASVANGSSVGSISKAVSNLYFAVSATGPRAECVYLRHAFRVLRKPYEGERVSPKDWDRAIWQIETRTE